MYDFSGETATFPMDVEDITWLSVAQDTQFDQQAYRNVNEIMEQKPSGGEYVRKEQLFFVPQGQAGQEFSVMPGDTITDSASNAYVVLSSGGGFSGAAFQLSCRLLGVFGRTIIIQVPVDSIDAYGSPITTFTSLDSQAAAINEQLSERVDFQNGVVGYRRYFSIWILDEPELPDGTIITDDREYTYTVREIHSRRKIGELMEIVAVIEP